MLGNTFDILLELSPWLLLGAIAAGLMHVLVPAGWLMRHLRGRYGVLKAVMVGVPLPLCSCGVIPVGLGLRKDGASTGATVGFLISTPQTGVDSILVSASFLGLPFALFKVIAAMVTGLLGGWLAEEGSTSSETSPEPSDTPNIHVRSFRAFADQSLMLIRAIWVWLVIGVLASALINSWLPRQSLADLPAMTGISAMLITLVISVPLYVCATASVPVAAALVAGGLPAGAALVFLMAGPATNVATLGAVYRTLGLRSLVIYLGAIVVGSVAAGLAFDWLIDPSAMASVMHHQHTSWWQIASAAIVCVLIVVFVIDDSRHWLRRRRQSRNASPSSIRLPVEGMTCNGCASRLERALSSATGIRQASVSFSDREAVIDGDRSSDAIRELIHEAGFHVPDTEPTFERAEVPNGGLK